MRRLDAAATKIGDRLWNGDALDAQTAARLLGLFHLRWRDGMGIASQLSDEGIYLILAMTPDGIVRVKPQNLVIGLPTRFPERVS